MLSSRHLILLAALSGVSGPLWAQPAGQVTAASTPPPAVAMGHHVEAPLWAVERRPGDGTGAYHTGRYPNLFAQQLGISPQETHARIDAIYRQLFHGDGQEQRLYFETGANANGPLAYITDWANNDARSEGMSYGMMIAVQLGHKREFDALWNWSKTYMEVTDPANPSYGYFAWSMNTDGTPRSTAPRPMASNITPWRSISRPTAGAMARAFTTTALRPTASCVRCATAR
jgi:oligosaccharide reducing-end xylanase